MSASGPVHPFRAAAEARDIDALLSTLASDVVLHSPVTFHPYVGRETVGGLLRLVSEAFEGWHCTEELHGPNGTVEFVFRTRVNQRELEGVDLLRLDPDGLVSDLTVMIRPLSGLVALAQAIGPKVDAAGLKPSNGAAA
ncbi:MAG: nuclear transport factor 2 family protein [Streptosporangiaceae bacterium]